MRIGCAVLTTLLPVLCLAQMPDTTANQRVIDELKSIRAALERIEKTQHALLALTRLQFDETQLASLEAQRLRLAAQEAEANREIAKVSRVLDAPPPLMISPEDGSVKAAPRPDLSAEQARHSKATAALQEVESTRQSIDAQVTRLRSRIAAAEKLLEEILR